MSTIELTAQECSNCKTKMFPKRNICPKCRSKILKNWNIPKTGIIYSFTTVNFPLYKYDKPPYYVALIEVNSDSKFLITSRLEYNSGVKIGDKVKISIETFDESGSMKILFAKPI